jgi:signal transduction histidine kinase
LQPAPDRVLEELRVLHALAEAINRSSAVEEVYPEALLALRRITAAERAAVLLYDASGSLEFVAWHGLSEAYRKAVAGHSPWAVDDADPAPIVLADPAEEPALAPLLPVLRAEGIASLAFIPIAHQGRLLGKFMLYFDSPRTLAAEEVRLALTVAEYLALAISRQRAVEEIRRLNAQLEARVRHRTRQLELAHREMEAFCYSISHDLRAPLRALDGFARILLEEAGEVLDETDRDNLRRIIAASGRMSRLMDDLLRLSRFGRAAMRVERVDLSAIAAAVAAKLREEAGGAPTLHIRDGLIERADAGLMRVALEQLLANAWKYTRQCEQPRIEFAAREQDGKTLFYVRDNGVGFDMRYAAKLFSPFQRLHPADEYEGNGIGLAIVARIVQRHGGRIWAESAPGRGATFSFTLWTEWAPTELASRPAPPVPEPVSSRPSFPPV